MLDLGLDELEVIPYQTDIYFAVKCRLNQDDWEIIRSKGHSKLTSESGKHDKKDSLFARLKRKIDEERLTFVNSELNISDEALWLQRYYPGLKVDTYKDLKAARIYKETVMNNSRLLLKRAEDVDGGFIANINSVTLPALATLNISFSILLSILLKRSITSEMRFKSNDAVSVIIESSGIADEAMTNANRLRKFKSDLLCVPEKDRLSDTDEIVADTDRKIDDLERISDSHCKKIRFALENVAKAVTAANTADKIAKAKEARAALLANLK